MKKFIAFILSASMCLSLMTALTPAFAYGQEDTSEQTIMARAGDPEKEDRPVKEHIGIQGDNV